MCARLDIRCEEYSPSLIFRDDTLAVKRRSQVFQAQRWAAIRAQDRQRETRRSRNHRLRDEAINTDYDSSTSDCRSWSSQSRAELQMDHDHQADSLPPGEPAEGSWDRHNHASGHIQSPLATSPGRCSRMTIHPGTGSSSASFGTETLLASTPRSLGLESDHLVGRASVCEELTLADSSVGATSSAATVSPISEPGQDQIVDRTHARSKAAFNIPSSGTENPPLESDLASTGNNAARTSGLAQHGHTDNPVATASVLSYPSTPGTEAIMSTVSPEGLDDWWLNRSDMPGLPSIYKHIWQSFGRSNDAFRYALLGLVPASLPNRWYPTTERSRRIEFYSMALRAMTQTRQASAKTSDLGVELTILSVFLLLEMRFGTFKGGLAHCARSDFLVTQN